MRGRYRVGKLYTSPRKTTSNDFVYDKCGRHVKVVKILLNVKEALEGLNADKMIEHYTDNFFEVPLSSKWFNDQSSLRQYYQQLFSLPDVRFSDYKILEAEHFATIEWTWSRVSPVTRSHIEFEGLSYRIDRQ